VYNCVVGKYDLDEGMSGFCLEEDDSVAAATDIKLESAFLLPRVATLFRFSSALLLPNLSFKE